MKKKKKKIYFFHMKIAIFLFDISKYSCYYNIAYMKSVFTFPARYENSFYADQPTITGK